MGWDRSEQLGKEVLERRKRVLGENHGDMFVSMLHPAGIYKDSGRDVDTIELFKSCLRRQEQSLGPDKLLVEGVSRLLQNGQS